MRYANQKEKICGTGEWKDEVAQQAWKRGVYRIYSNDFEDATKYIGAKMNRDMYRFLIDSKQKNLDVFFVFHSLAACPLDLIRISNFVVLFKTNEAMNPHLHTKFPFPEIPARWLNRKYFTELCETGYEKNDRILKPKVLAWLCQHLDVEMW